MKLILFAAIVMFKWCQSAPADSSTEMGSKNDSENDITLNQPGFAVAQHPASMSYVSNDGEQGSTGVVFQFRRSIKSDNTEIEARRRSALDKGFMRFGRGGTNMMRFGRSPAEDEPEEETDPMEMEKKDKNMMRFGRAGNLLRFGRSFEGLQDYNDVTEEDDYGDYSENQLYRSSERNDDKQKGNEIIRFGRSSSESEDDEGIDIESGEENRIDKKGSNIIRFGRAGNMMRFGRNEKNMMRFGKRENMMRFGRSYNEAPKAVATKPPKKFYTPERTSVLEQLSREGRAGNGPPQKFYKNREGRAGNGPPQKFYKNREGRASSNAPPTKFYGSQKQRLFGRAARANEPRQKFYKQGSPNDRNLLRLGRSGNLIRFGRNEKNLMRFGKRSGPQAFSSSTKIYCEENDCVVQKNEDTLTDDIEKDDQLHELFGNDDASSKQGYGEYVNEK